MLVDVLKLEGPELTQSDSQMYLYFAYSQDTSIKWEYGKSMEFCFTFVGRMLSALSKNINSADYA